MTDFKDPYGYFQRELLKPAKESQLQGRKLHFQIAKTSKHGDFSLKLLGKQQTDTEQDTKFLLDQVSSNPVLTDYIKDIQQSSVGSLAVFLHRDVVLRDGLSAVLDDSQYGRSDSTGNRDIVLCTHLSGQSSDGVGVSLNDLRTALVSMHLTQVLRYAGHCVKQCELSRDVSHASRSMLAQFGYDPHPTPEQTLYQSTLNSLRERLCYCGHILREGVTNETDQKDYRTEQNSRDSAKLLDLKSYIQQNGLRGYDSNINTVKVLEDDGSDGAMLTKVTNLECYVRTTSQQYGESPVSHMVHVCGCNRSFQAQQTALSWQIITEVKPAPHQSFLSHSVVSSSGHLKTSDDFFSTENLFSLRVKQMHQSYHVKYGDQVKGSDWEAAIRGIAQAVIKMEILSVNPKTPVKIDSTDNLETPADCRDVLFVLYNCARLAKLFQHYQELVNNGTYPSLPPVQHVDFKLLREEEEWDLYLKYIFTFPSLLKEMSSSLLASETVKAHCSTNKVCTFLIALSRDVSSYYSRVHVLGESRPHLFPVMFARLLLLKAVYQVMCTCLNLLSIDPPTQM